MTIKYIDPLSKAWGRMKKALFQPFDIGKWFALGFTVFLAHLFNSQGSGFNFSLPSNRRPNLKLPDIERIPAIVSAWVNMHPLLTTAILAGIFALIVIILVITWLSSRGVFMFLDNVAHDRALIANPWREYRIQGNSLFLWRIGLGVVVTLTLLPLMLLGVIQIVLYSRGHSPFSLLGIIALGFVWFVLSLFITYVSLFTNSFVVPIMYRHNLRILEAWRKFFPILASHFFHFILFGLFVFLLFAGIVIAVILASCLTCCIGFILLALPYIGSVVLLPVYYTLRAFSLEYLAQWGADYSVFPDKTPPSGDVPPAPVPPPPPVDPPPGVTILGM